MDVRCLETVCGILRKFLDDSILNLQLCPGRRKESEADLRLPPVSSLQHHTGVQGESQRFLLEEHD